MSGRADRKRKQIQEEFARYVQPEEILEKIINKLSVNHNISTSEAKKALGNENILETLTDFIIRASEILDNYVELKYNKNEENNYNNMNNDVIQNGNSELIVITNTITTTATNENERTSLPSSPIFDTYSINHLDLDENDNNNNPEVESTFQNIEEASTGNSSDQQQITKKRKIMTSSLTQEYNLRNKKDINYNYGRVLKRRHRKSKPQAELHAKIVMLENHIPDLSDSRHEGCKGITEEVMKKLNSKIKIEHPDYSDDEFSDSDLPPLIPDLLRVSRNVIFTGEPNRIVLTNTLIVTDLISAIRVSSALTDSDPNFDRPIIYILK
ncbi:3603_t:CDS:2 [Funneliformis caledonium]|uniref:3603_t:CDS:1 n=1 Tax=Funneliformis caledonium TaxID=1117310 RepID=A0A9N9GQF6_9GLOM|nr:3603_t:CDS:2 [Funneliformis caledonium]